MTIGDLAGRAGFTLAEVADLFGAGHERSPEAVLDAAHSKLAVEFWAGPAQTASAEPF